MDTTRPGVDTTRSGVDTTRPGVDTTRAKVVCRFHGALDDEVTAQRLEVCLWNWTIRTCQRDHIPLYWEDSRFRYRYTTRALSLEFNAKHNPEMLANLRSKRVSVKAFANMTPVEMWPEKWQEAYQKVALRQLRREADVDASTVPDGAYTCHKCKSQKTVYTSMQIRSADEPMTTFVRCLNCGKSWKD